MLLMLGSWTADAIGIHSVFGGFILGVAMLRGFYLAIMSAASIASVMLIREDDIDHALARGADDHGSGPRIVNVRHLFWDRRLAIFALCAVLFHSPTLQYYHWWLNLLPRDRMQSSLLW